MYPICANGAASPSKMHASPKLSPVTHAASRTLTTNQPPVAATRPASDWCIRASATTERKRTGPRRTGLHLQSRSGSERDGIGMLGWVRSRVAPPDGAGPEDALSFNVFRSLQEAGASVNREPYKSFERILLLPLHRQPKVAADQPSPCSDSPPSTAPGGPGPADERPGGPHSGGPPRPPRERPHYAPPLRLGSPSVGSFRSWR